MSRQTPSKVPTNAQWNDADQEWELGEKDPLGRRIGEWRFWRADGSLLTIEPRDKGGRLHGVFRRFHPNGELAQQANYVEGRSHGVSFWTLPTSGECDHASAFVSNLPGTMRMDMPYDQGVAQPLHFTLYNEAGLRDPIAFSDGIAIDLEHQLHKLVAETTLRPIADAFDTKNGQSIPTEPGRWIFKGKNRGGWGITHFPLAGAGRDYLVDGAELARVFTLSANSYHEAKATEQTFKPALVLPSFSESMDEERAILEDYGELLAKIHVQTPSGYVCKAISKTLKAMHEAGYPSELIRFYQHLGPAHSTTIGAVSLLTAKELIANVEEVEVLEYLAQRGFLPVMYTSAGNWIVVGTRAGFTHFYEVDHEDVGTYLSHKDLDEELDSAYLTSSFRDLLVMFSKGRLLSSTHEVRTGAWYVRLERAESSTYWEGAVQGCEVLTRYGKIGNKGRKSCRRMGDNNEASELLETALREKKRSGYLETLDLF